MQNNSITSITVADGKQHLLVLAGGDGDSSALSCGRLILATHQPLDRAACHSRTFTPQLPARLVGSMDLHIGLPDAFNLRRQGLSR